MAANKFIYIFIIYFLILISVFGQDNSNNDQSYNDSNSSVFRSGLSSVYNFNMQWQTYREDINVITRDDLLIQVVISIIIRPNYNQLYFLEQEVGPEYYNHVVKPDFRSSVRMVFANYPASQITKNSTNLTIEIKKLIGEQLSGRYIEINKVNIEDIVSNFAIQNSVQKKIAREQDLLTKDYEIKLTEKDNEIKILNAKQEAEIFLIKAKAESESLKIVNSKLTARQIRLRALENPKNKIIYLPSKD